MFTRKTKMKYLSTPAHADGKSGEDFIAHKKHFWNFTGSLNEPRGPTLTLSIPIFKTNSALDLGAFCGDLNYA